MTRVLRWGLPHRGAPRDLVELRILHGEQARQLLARRGTQRRWAVGYPGPGDIEAANNLVRQLVKGEDPGAFGPYEILTARDRRVIGGIGFHAPPDDKGIVEVGYGIVESERNKGYATAALCAIVRLASELGVREVVARAEIENWPSRRVMEKAGLTYTGVVQGLAAYHAML